ncbi:hypothetical protein [Streptomyces sp. NPDC026589]|uniref:hypothetical protein n=1 Tax=Streptomyces sp. NPDC026589 TaxID=3155609 RepID=UPI00340C2E46
MSLEAMIWVLSGDAPVSDVNEYAVLGAMADQADPDGCGTWLSKETIATRVKISEETVKRCWRNMSKRGLIARGDQSHVSHYRADRRPVVYDLLIPYDWFSNVNRINTERGRYGRPPLTPADRPPIAPAPARKARGDKGKARPKKQTAPAPDQEVIERGNSETPREGDSPPPHGETTSRPRGNCQSSTGELEDPQPSENTQSKNPGNNDGPPVRPSVPAGDGVREAAPAARTDGRGGGIEEDQVDGPVPAGGSGEGGGVTRDATAGSGPEAKGAARAGGAPGGGVVRVDSRGVRLLIEAADRETLNDLRVRGTALRDQGLMVDGLLEAGHSIWTVREVIALPMPDPITTSRSAVISGRLRKLAGMPPATVPGAPQQAPLPQPRWEDAPTPTPPEWSDHQAQMAPQTDCAGDDGLCPTLAVVGETLCPTHLDWPLCPGHDGHTCTARTRTGEQCAICAHDALYARIDAELPVTETEDGTCPGHTGPCGRPVVASGLCRRCRVASQADRDRIEAEWHAARTSAVAAHEGHTSDQEHQDQGQVDVDQDLAERETERLKAAELAAELDEETAYREAAERTERHQQDLDRTARKQADDEETARLRAELAAQYPDLAAVSGSVRETQEAQQPLPAPF